MADRAWAEKLADLRGIKECLGYLERELFDKELSLAAKFVGAAECAIEQEIAALIKRCHDGDDDSLESQKEKGVNGDRRSSMLLN